MKIIAQKNFELQGIFYEAGDPVEVNSKELLVKLNEKGFIEPLTPKEIQNFNKTEKEEKENVFDRNTRYNRED